MRKILVLSMIVLMILPTVSLFAQDSTEVLQSRVIARFDESPEVDFLGDSFSWIVQVNGATGIDPEPVFQLIESVPTALYNILYPAPENPKSFGVQAAFVRPGYNYLEFIPVYEDDPTKGIPLQGIVKSVDLWLWGSYRNYYLEAHFRDYRGAVHVVDFGDTFFRGWKNLKAPVPKAAWQMDINDPLGRSLELTKIVLWTTPGASVDPFYIYLDEVRVLTDTYLESYDGVFLADPDNVDVLWTQGSN